MRVARLCRRLGMHDLAQHGGKDHAELGMQLEEEAVVAHDLGEPFASFFAARARVAVGIDLLRG